MTSVASAPKNGVDFVKDTYIPIFTNKPGDSRNGDNASSSTSTRVI
jgi:hypothetical protein